MKFSLPFFTRSKDHGIAILLSFVTHLFLFFGTSASFVTTAQYGVASGYGGMELYLTAALPKTDATPARTTGQRENAYGEIQNLQSGEMGSGSEIIPLGQDSKKAQSDEQRTATPINDTPFAGDGSSPVPGTDATTFYSPGGAVSKAKAKHLKNPAPPYPYESLRLGQEGLVILTAFVDKSGHPAKVAIKQSSGFSLLDQSALQTIRRWKFDPAHIGFLPVDSKVDVPIRFALQNKKM